MKNFEDFFGGSTFPTLGAKITAHATAPAQPQVFETDLGPHDVFAAAVTEVFRIKLGDAEKAKLFWNAFTKSIPNRNTSISGKSLNLEEELFVGIIGWESTEVSSCNRKEKKLTREGSN